MESVNAEEFTVEAVERALQQLYYDPEMGKKNVAQKWLTQAQASPQAWHFCWALLRPDKVPEIQFFGASTLHAKISRHWSDLPTGQLDSLRSQLIAQVGQFASGPKMVLTRLCVALASLVLHVVPETWPTAVPDLLCAFQTGEVVTEADGQARCLALLEILGVLPEELQSSRIAASRRSQLRGVLAVEWSSVCSLLQQLLQQADAPCGVRERVMRCVSSWLTLDIALKDSEGLLQSCFALLKESELFDMAVETIVSIISQPDCQRFADSLLKVVPQVLGLQEQLKKAVQDGDMETSHGICRIAVALGETHCRTLLEQVDHWQGFQALVSMIMSCTATPGRYPVDETSSSLTLTFWYTLQDEMTSLDAERQTLYLQIYRPVYFQLVDVLLQKACFPRDEDYATWSADDKEQFRTYRVDISDTLMYVYELLGPELLRNLYDKLGTLLTDTTHPSSWQDIEALLFGFQSIAETVDVSYSDVIPGLIGLIPLITANNIQLAETIMFTIGSLAEWLADHSLMLASVLPVVLHGLSNPDLSVSCVSALKRICRECRHDLHLHASDIMAVSQAVLVKEIHKSPQCMWIMQALGFLLSALPSEEILGKLLSLVTPHIQQLEKLANELPSSANKLPTIHILGLLSNLFSTFDLNKQSERVEVMRPVQTQPHSNNPVVVVLQQAFPLIQTVLNKWLNEPEVVEAVCAVFEKSLKTLIHDFAPLVTQLCELIGQMFSAYPQASTLDLTRQLVHIFGCEKDRFTPITALLELITNITMSIFQLGSRDHPDVVESFMQLHAQVLRRKSELYLSDHLDIKAVFYCGILSFKFPETPTLKATCLLFTELISHCEDVPAVRELLQDDGKLLLQTLLEAIGGQCPSSLAEHYAEVLFSVSRNCPSVLSLWLREALLPPGFPSSHLTAENKEHFCQQILREQASKRRMKDIVKEFALLSRGLEGTEYTASY
ncbi:importin-13 isoform X2 [Rhinichthys klamathensis goyatoka]|uniref:importin-13 isoform X2 n=1 Tax=Rhinichthys klamathensis goyatoka TaxID=3034132 RepID=UPI0024B5E420|nr:importin-13 isoform X2 [Rhinichthys klamathensis goyatoka]